MDSAPAFITVSSMMYSWIFLFLRDVSKACTFEASSRLIHELPLLKVKKIMLWQYF